MKILPVQLVREADAFTIAHEPIQSVDLMERAGAACALEISALTDRLAPVAVIAGQGNNGGDGLVIARLLHEMGYRIQIFIMAFGNKGTPDFEANLRRVELAEIPITWMYQKENIPDFSGFRVLIDAIFGSGLTRPVTGLAAEVIAGINDSGAQIIAIDMPSGLCSDEWTNPDEGAIVEAAVTLTLEIPKLSLLMSRNFRYVGCMRVIPIGLHKEFIRQASTPWSLFAMEEAQQVFMPRGRVAHKGHFGHGLLIAGSRDKGGAALLAAKSALRSGAGLLTAHVPGCLATAINVALPEAMLSIDFGDGFVADTPNSAGYTAVAIGPGLGSHPDTEAVLENLLQTASAPLLLDADALNILARNKPWLKMLPPITLLTPHPKEFERLAGSSGNEFQQLQTAVQFAAEYGCVVVLKSAFTTVINPDGQCSFNVNGNAGLAKGGSGDTLTGIILGLLCRGYVAWDAARLGVYIHARAAELAAQTCGLDAILASEVTEKIGEVYKELECKK